MTRGPVPDEALMALADGELPADESRTLRARIADDPELATRFATFVETRALAADPARAQSDAPPPDALVASILRRDAEIQARQPTAAGTTRPGLHVVSQRGEREVLARGVSARRGWQLPLAASIALAIGAAAGYLVTRETAERGGAVVVSIALPQDQLQAALDAVASGDSRKVGDGTITLVSTHRIASGEICREFEFARERPVRESLVAIACRRDGSWRARFAIAGTMARSDVFVPASGSAALADQHLRDLGSPGPVDEAAEAALKRNAWR